MRTDSNGLKNLNKKQKDNDRKKYIIMSKDRNSTSTDRKRP